MADIAPPPSPAEPTLHAGQFLTPDLSPSQVEKAAGWIREDLAKGKMSPEKATKAFDDLGTPAEQRLPDSRSEEERQLDRAFPVPKAGDYLIRWKDPLDPTPMSQTDRQADSTTREWLSSAGFPRETGNSLVTTISKVAQTTKGFSDQQLEDYGHKEYQRLQAVHKDKLEERLQSAALMIQALDAKQPGLKQLLQSRGIGDNAMVANMLIAQAQKYHARNQAKQARGK